ncbi:Mitochondrial ribosome small subunit biogenesis protein [Yamadazyma tenuis]|uniref:Genetic interactor of prohibitins 3, mitochondrial n=1 Tax=Candida tenuis (strain ATCC 10573 / BCRC 21748 / CBS 615 / JCM 9827 / NBRC 10315 / NRRL Y-1498 / VKM Y-70) TaxID=590646 RepID=G3BCN8_CANTC|nr:uncharacterized protein CANTEDRAFT_96285 [Yamadazyma tenuis ATCC 10573]EGV60841.1 hypothetical protein CANTEDRAFT_96285 [Yamadazyma tenuis ATCC 10573]WEJ93888.1 Mitochondrial ribosome small subunit biogenesis protein [Yamadazyma tenuis]
MLTRLLYIRTPHVFRRSASVLSNLVSKCSSCGIQLQSTSAAAPGYIPLVSHKPFQRQEDTIYNKYTKHLDPEDMALLNLHPTAAESQHPRHKHTSDSSYKDCLRCRQIKHKHQFNSVEETQNLSTTSIIDKVEHINGQMVYAISAIDFPLGINKQLVNQYKPIVVITKCDLIFPQKETMAKFPFYKEYMTAKFEIPPTNVFLVSSRRDWGLQTLNSVLQSNPQKYFIVGDINSGKSSLISKLLLRDRGDTRMKYDVWAARNGPGISNLPGFTRGELQFSISNYELIDLPGLNHMNFPNFARLKNVFKAPPLYRKGLYSSQYDTIKGGQVLAVGGFFYVKLPDNGMILQYKNLINVSPVVLRDTDRIGALEQKLDPSLTNKFLIPPTTKLRKLLIPPFVGKIDLVVKNLGYLELTPTGSKSDNKLIEVLVPENLDLQIIVRKPLVTYVQKVLSGRNKNGNVLSLPNLWKSTKVVQHYRNEKLYSRLYPFLQSQQQSIEALSGMQYAEDTEITRENYDAYWLE